MRTRNWWFKVDAGSSRSVAPLARGPRADRVRFLFHLMRLVLYTGVCLAGSYALGVTPRELLRALW